MIQTTDLDADALLSLCVEAERESWIAERRKLDLALTWALLHPAPADQAALGYVEHVGGDGTPDVEELTTESLGAAFGITTYAALQLVADALDLAYRLPRVWARVQALEVPAWRARRIAQKTAALTAEQAALVDAEVAPRAHKIGPVVLERVVAEVAALDDPAQQEADEVVDERHWRVRLFHGPMTGSGRWVGTSTLEITGDTGDLTDLFHQLNDAAVKAGGDEPIDVRRARAVRVIANRGRGDRPARTRLYLHADLADLETVGVGSVERLGPLSIARIKEWVGHTAVTVVPVIRMDRTDAVVQHDPPQWMRELVILRDARCVFPWCHTDARSCDLDHVVPYDEGGPTSPENLAPLCRRHHRAKTKRRWRYRRLPDGGYLWAGPQQREYLVDRSGTRPVS
jgi:HNH endonuclease